MEPKVLVMDGLLSLPLTLPLLWNVCLNPQLWPQDSGNTKEVEMSLFGVWGRQAWCEPRSSPSQHPKRLPGNISESKPEPGDT